jgi:dienelactone hydrolase
MGHHTVDFVGFRVSWLYRDLGLNVAVPVMPFHGPRSVGRRSGDGYLSGDFLDTIHAQAQAVWDARRLIAWLRKRGAPAVGIYGVSLGGHTAASIAAHEPGLDCVIAGIPASDLLDIIHANTSGVAVWLTSHLGFPWEDVRQIMRVISPLALPVRVPRDRCFLFAGRFDALAPPSQARALWEHWGRPRLVWYQGGHVSFFLEREVRDLIAEALRATGFVTDAWAAGRAHMAWADAGNF